MSAFIPAPPSGLSSPAVPSAGVAPLHRHRLAGCTPRPLAGYLKALGVLRCVAEQADPTARGCWQDEAFVLLTRLDAGALREFFLRSWRPSPFVSPWNKGSGLLGPDAKGVEPLERSTAARFALVRQGIADARALTREMEQAVASEGAIKAEANRLVGKAAKDRLQSDPAYKQRLAAATKARKRFKDQLQPECQRRWRGPTLRWLRAAVVLSGDGRAVFPALLGTGGNDSRLDFTKNAMQRLGNLFELGSSDGAPRPEAAPLLQSALFGEAVPHLVRGGIGMFSPAASGGANATSGPLGESMLNPWDLPLLLEGALLFTAGTSRRLGGSASERTVAPFSAPSYAAGYVSSSMAEEKAASEQWMPLWTRPWTAGELAALLAEGRCQLGARSSTSTMDVARAVARLGVARGVTAFERYGFIERNGQCHYAVPLGRWPVRAEPHAALLDDLEVQNWWPRLRRATRSTRAPNSMQRLEQRLGDMVMAALAHGSEPARWQAVLLLLAQLEAQLVASGSFTIKQRLGPIPRLSPAWVLAADDGGPELPLALALAGAAAGHDRRGRPVDGVRRHWLPLDRHGRFAARERALAHDPGVVVTGREPEAELIRLVQRRLLEAQAGASRTLPLTARPGTAARPAELMAWLRGEVDLPRTLWLARALAALDWGAFDPARHRPPRPAAHPDVDPGWAVLRLAHLPGALPDGRRVPVDPAIVRTLAAGDAPRAFALTLQRLRGAGLAAPLTAATTTPGLARTLAASLAFPISAQAADRLARTLDPHGASAAQEAHHVG